MNYSPLLSVINSLGIDESPNDFPFTTPHALDVKFSDVPKEIIDQLGRLAMVCGANVEGVRVTLPNVSLFGDIEEYYTGLSKAIAYCTVLCL